MLRSLAAASLVLAPFSFVLAQPPVGLVEPPPVEAVRPYVAAGSVTTGDSESRTIVEENPTLVRELLLLAADDVSSAFPAIFCLGTPAIEPLIRELKSDDEDLRTAAAGALCYACAHEDAPRSRIVKELLALKSAHPDGDYGELLVLAIRMTHPDVRASIRTVSELELTGGFRTGATSPSHCPPGGCPTPYVDSEPSLAPVTPAVAN